MSIVHEFIRQRDQPVQLHLRRTLTQYSNIGPSKEPIVLATGDENRVTSLAGRVAWPLDLLLAKCIDSDVTLYLDFDVTNLMTSTPKTSLLDMSGRLEKVEDGIVTIRSRTMKGQGLRMHVPAKDICFFYSDVPVDMGAGLSDGSDDPTLELLLDHKGKTAYAYVPAGTVLFLATPMAIALV